MTLTYKFRGIEFDYEIPVADFYKAMYSLMTYEIERNVMSAPSKTGIGLIRNLFPASTMEAYMDYEEIGESYFMDQLQSWFEGVARVEFEDERASLENPEAYYGVSRKD